MGHRDIGIRCGVLDAGLDNGADCGVRAIRSGCQRALRRHGNNTVGAGLVRGVYIRCSC